MPDKTENEPTRDNPVEQQVIQPPCQLNSIRFSHDGKFIAGGGFEGEVHLWSVSGEGCDGTTCSDGTQRMGAWPGILAD